MIRYQIGIRTRQTLSLPRIEQVSRPKSLLSFAVFLVSPASARVVALRFVGLSMDDWLVGHFTIFGVHGQNWMLIALVIVPMWIHFLWWSRQ